MDVAEGQVPDMRRADFRDVPAGRTGDGATVCGGVSGVWADTGDGEVAFFRVLDPDFDGNGFARPPFTGFGDVAGIRGGTTVFSVCAAQHRICRELELAIAASALAGKCGWFSGWTSGSGLRKLFVVGIGGGLQSGAQARGHGHGRREDDGHGGGVRGLAGNILDDSAGKPARERDRVERGGWAVSRRLEKKIGGTREPERSWERECAAVDDCESVPTAAGNIPGHRSADHRVWRAVTGEKLAIAERDLRIGKRADQQVRC